VLSANRFLLYLPNYKKLYKKHAVTDSAVRSITSKGIVGSRVEKTIIQADFFLALEKSGFLYGKKCISVGFIVLTSRYITLSKGNPEI
jgi:hypothetical protein